MTLIAFGVILNLLRDASKILTLQEKQRSERFQPLLLLCLHGGNLERFVSFTRAGVSFGIYRKFLCSLSIGT